MKHLITGAAIFVMVLSLANCKSKKIATTTEPAAVFTPASQQMAIAEKRWPGTNVLEVQEGQTIFTTKCTRCHQPVEITSLTEKKWLHEIDDMSPKADLTPEEKLKLTKHILSYREAYATASAK
jgi:cytochrome c5